MNIEHVSNEDLLKSLQTFIGVERRAVARTIECLIAVEERRLHLELAYSSMFDFCLRFLRLSENEAYRRLAAARLVGKFPVMLDALRCGTVSLTNLVLLRDLFTESNVDALLLEIAGKTKKEVEALVARLQPKPDVPDSIRVVGAQPDLAARALSDAGGATPNHIAAATAPSSIRALSEERHCFTFTGSAVLREKVERACALTHRHPKGDLAALVESALDLLIEKLEKEKLGKTARPRTAKPSTDPTYVSAATRREVTTRDEMRCTFVSPDGERCPARERLELDHRQPRARGGAGNAANIRILCQAHNKYEAEKAFGREHVEHSIHAAQAKRHSRKPSTSTSTNANLNAALIPLQGPSVSTEADSGVPKDKGCAGGVLPPRASERSHAIETRETLRGALVGDLGFNTKEVDRALADMTAPETWSRSLESLLREAIGRLTKGARATAS